MLQRSIYLGVVPTGSATCRDRDMGSVSLELGRWPCRLAADRTSLVLIAR